MLSNVTNKVQIAQAGVNVELLKCLGNSLFVPKFTRRTSSKIIERSIRLPIELDRSIGWLANQARQSKSAWIREALVKAVE